MRIAFSFVVSAALTFAAVIGTAQAQVVNPASPQPDPSTLSPGLAVDYYNDMYRHVDELEEAMTRYKPKRGGSLEQLNYQVGQKAVLNQTRTDGVGAHIYGYIMLEKTGIYTFLAQSNDGIRVRIDDQIVLQDPDVHRDRYSDFGEILVNEPGYYKIEVHYFERKNTSTIKLFWLEPDMPETATLPLVPAEVLFHTTR